MMMMGDDEARSVPLEISVPTPDRRLLRAEQSLRLPLAQSDEEGAGFVLARRLRRMKRKLFLEAVGEDYLIAMGQQQEQPHTRTLSDLGQVSIAKTESSLDDGL